MNHNANQNFLLFRLNPKDETKSRKQKKTKIKKVILVILYN